MNVSAIQHLYAFEDGDTLTPSMGVKIDAGFGLQQYWNPTTKTVIATDFTEHNAILYPQAYSSKKGSIIVPEAVGQQWYYNNISTEGAILEDGAVKSKFADLFEVSTVVVNNMTFPALVIKGNLANETDFTDKYIYYVSTYNGKQFTCSQLIPIQASVGETCKILLSCEGEDGTGDNVLSNDNDWVKYTANLQAAGITVAGSVTYKWQLLDNGEWMDISSVSGMYEVNGNIIKLYNAAVEGVETFRAVAVYQEQTYTEVFEVTDIHDPYYIDNGCSHPSGAVNAGETATLSPKVYDRSSGELSTGWTFVYTIYNKADGSVITDFTVNELTYDNINKYTGISIRIEANKA